MAVHRHFPRNAIPLSETLEAWVFIAGLIGAIWLLRSDLIPFVISHTVQFGVLGSFAEGMLFTSVLTTVPAIVAMIESAQYIPAWELAIAGGIGAVCADLLLFRFVRSRLVEHILRAALSPWVLRIARKINNGPLWWLGPVFGMVVIASPLPDELGLFMMGLSHLKVIQFVPLLFIANAGGIYLIALAAQQF